MTEVSNSAAQTALSNICEVGKLPVPIVINGAPVQNVKMMTVTMEESLAAQSKMQAGQYYQIAELASMLTWQDASIQGQAVTYAQLASSAQQNLTYLNQLRTALEEKERLAVMGASSAS